MVEWLRSFDGYDSVDRRFKSENPIQINKIIIVIVIVIIHGDHSKVVSTSPLQVTTVVTHYKSFYYNLLNKKS